MKALVSALALLVGSNVMAAAADRTLKFKLVTFYADQEDGEYHFDKDFSVKEDQNGKGAGHSTYYFPDGSIVASDHSSIRRHKPAAMLSAKSRSFPAPARIRARPAEAR
jgi:hypothetical protein